MNSTSNLKDFTYITKNTPMKNTMLLTLSFFLSILILHAQEETPLNKNTPEHKWSATTSYGFASYMSLNRSFDHSNAPHGVFEFALDYLHKENASFGFSFMRSTMTNSYDRIFEYTFLDTGNQFQVVFDNYQSTFVRDIYELHYRNFYFENKLSTSIGLYVFNDKRNYYNPFRRQLEGENYNYFGVSFAVGYYYPVKDYFDIGVNVRGLFSLDGTDFMALPFVRFKF